MHLHRFTGSPASRNHVELYERLLILRFFSTSKCHLEPILSFKVIAPNKVSPVIFGNIEAEIIIIINNNNNNKDKDFSYNSQKEEAHERKKKEQVTQ